MDVPTRQTCVMAFVEPAERTSAAACTIAGGIKSADDLTMWRWFRRVRRPDTVVREPA
jgi:hypothetical protein